MGAARRRGCANFSTTTEPPRLPPCSCLKATTSAGEISPWDSETQAGHSTHSAPKEYGNGHISGGGTLRYKYNKFLTCHHRDSCQLIQALLLKLLQIPRRTPASLSLALTESFIMTVQVIALAVISVVYFVIRYLNRTDVPKIKNLPEIPGVPIFGNLLQLGSHHAKVAQKWAKQYGPVFQVRMGNRVRARTCSIRRFRKLWKKLT